MLEEIFAEILWAEHNKSKHLWFRFKTGSHQSKFGAITCVLDQHKYLHVFKTSLYQQSTYELFSITMQRKLANQ